MNETGLKPFLNCAQQRVAGSGGVPPSPKLPPLRQLLFIRETLYAMPDKERKEIRNMDLLIRNECSEDFRTVEELTRDAFWNLHVPGCDEHYLVHLMRSHPDFLPKLDFVAVLDNRIVGNIMFTKSRLINENNLNLDTITFGPVSVLPESQKKGIGSAIIKHAIKNAVNTGFKVIIIEGHPYNYCKHGFVGSKSVNVYDSEGRFPYSLLVLELEKGCLQNHEWKFQPSDVYNIDEKGFNEYDKHFPPKEKGYKTSQEEFNIASKAFIE